MSWLQIAPESRWLLCTPTGAGMNPATFSQKWAPVADAFVAKLRPEHWLNRQIARYRAEAEKVADPRRRALVASHGRLDFYEATKHRACTRMVTPLPDGLGMPPRDVSFQCYGHSTSADIIEAHYVGKQESETLQRIRRAAGWERPSLWVVGE